MSHFLLLKQITRLKLFFYFRRLVTILKNNRV